ncbi:MAG TPA: serine/threonine-protein kinase [Thermoleophilaceae bacterium]|nr:serine/threonine-protein kinase [Thermoleophilaceae bacterium]
MADGSQPRLLAGRYRCLSTIGVGGMARVYLAEDERLGRQVAVKQLHAAGPEDAALRFEREAKLGASLNHPNLVSIYDIATDEESVLIVMEYVDGETLQDALRRGRPSTQRVMEILRDVAGGLDHAHTHGVVHRDVKPANILLRRDGVAKLADLGIATAAERTSITQSNVVLGTASYMAPEQLAGERAGPPADVYALAAVAFEALSGRKAREGKSPLEVAHDVVSGPLPDLRDAWGDAPPAAAKILARGMEREPERRPPSAGRLVADLERALESRREGRDATEATAALAPSGSRSAAAVAAVGSEQPPSTAPAAPPARARPRDERAVSAPIARARPARRRVWAPLAALALVLVAVIVGVAALSGGGEGGDGGDAGSRERAANAGTASGERSDRNGATASDRAATEERETSPPVEPDPEPAPEPDPATVTGDPVALNERGFELMQAGDYEGAIPLLEQAVAAYPEGSQELTYAYALYNLGRSLRLAGRAEEAVPILERRLQIPNQTETVQRELDAARAAS